ncbi:MAG: regulatory protein RecX [Balneolaceae bacterium]|nr:regulatory protein RecX [Balneolaceae bacterium]
MNNRHRNSESDQSSAIRDKLPLTITEISVQKKNRERFSLYHNSEFLIGVSTKTLTDLSIKKGVELTPFLYDEIRSSENLNSVKESALRYLARRDHSSGELKVKLGKKGIDDSAIAFILEEFSNRGYIDDESFAKSFAKEKAEMNRWGPNKITAALYKKRVPKKIIDKAIKNVTENLQQEQICVDLALKKKQRFLREEDLIKRKQKIYNYLAGRGFSNSIIKKSLPLITEALDA